MKIVKIAIVVALSLILCSCWQTATGEKVGTVIKFAQEGAFVNTWEGELIRGGMQGGSGAFSTTPLHFTVEDPALVQKVEEALTGQYEVVVKYRREAWAPFRSECNHKNGQNDIGQCIFLTSIERR